MISVATRQEIYDFIEEQQCDCGNQYYTEQITLNKKGEIWCDLALVRCQSCGIHKEFEFDVTQLFKDSSMGFNLQGWELPKAGRDNFYPVNEKGFSKELDNIFSSLNDSELSDGEFNEFIMSALDENYPKILGRYQVFRSREGSMGTSYLCVDTQWSPSSARPYFVVCKTVNLSENIDLNKEKIHGILQERDISLRVGQHKNLVLIFDVIQFSPAKSFIVMEFIPPSYLQGTTLDEWIIGDSVVETTLALRFASDICNGMIFCQGKFPGFGHGDLKPENLFVGPGKVLKIGDFGLASARDINGLKLGENVGTPYYLAPEFNGTQSANEAGDVYSFGLILLEMLTGNHPFKHITDKEQLLNAHKEGEIILNNVSETWLQVLLKRCLSTNPCERPTFVEILKVLNTNREVYDGRVRDIERLSEEIDADLNNKALRLISIGNTQTGVNILKRIINSNPNNFIAKQNLAYGYSKLGEYEKAEAIYQEILLLPDAKEKTESSAQLFSNYAAHILRHKKHLKAEEAIIACEKALNIDKNHFLAMVNKAVALNTLGESHKAINVLEKARKIDPQNIVLLYEMAFAYFKIFEKEKKEKVLEKSLKVLNDLIQVDFTFAPSYNLYSYIISNVPIKNQKNVSKFLNKLDQNSIQVKILHNKLNNIRK
ncbi:protein kinase family protein [Peribacillus frigoritolerans]|uniref:protein kinase family protein n=1 Tax=Peribacillus castrilensis TaxID=2897690 RepID=UPI00296F2B0D|nr:tetratricopeptide repeat-containing serine/threonine-protein kinase [Peribacillus castrilensis]